MAGTANAYGQINPQMVDPYNIEAPLAAMAADPSKQGIGLPLLALYRSERGLQSQYAAQEMQDQHKFALQKLMADQAKSAGEIINSGGQHGTLGVLATNPMTAGFLQGADQTQLWNRQDLSNRQMVGNIIKDTGQGAQALTESGNPLVPGAANSVIGPGMTSPMDPLKIRTAQIAAAAKAAGGDKVHQTAQVVDPGTGVVWGLGSNSGPALVAAVAERRQSLGIGADGVPTPVGGAPGGKSVSSAQPAATSAAKPAAAGATTTAASPAIVQKVDALKNQLLASGNQAQIAFGQAIQQSSTGGKPTVSIINGVPHVKAGGQMWSLGPQQ